MTNIAPDTGSITDIDLLKAAARRDRSALSTFYDRHAAALYGLALKILRDEALAQDVLQDLFLFLWENAGRFIERRGSPVGWMMISCRNRCIDKLRQKERRQRRSVNLDETTLQSIEMNESESPLEFVHYKEAMFWAVSR